MLTIKEVISISVKLANKAYIHLLMALEFTIEPAIEPYMETNPFTYSMATTAGL